MIIIEKNLEQLIAQAAVCDRALVDDYSIKIKLGRDCYRVRDESVSRSVVYESHPDPSTLFSDRVAADQNLILAPGERVLACSKHSYKMPLDCFGLVQTKGTLARLFVQATCNDGQVEPGFEGFITLELLNLSPWKVELPVGSDVAQMYVIKCSSPASKGYSGRYSDASKIGPTIARFSP